MYLIIDCNNFYVSCQEVFNPKLKGRPVVVAGRNGGCIIARSNEAKALGLKMSQPLFTCKDLLIKHSVITLETNFPLYFDMSQRVMQIIESFGLKTQIYSVDEAFVECKASTLYVAKQIRQTILKYTGITVSIGIAPTKTLAKLANLCAKRTKKGIHTLDPEEDLKNFTVDQVWGIGKKGAEKLNKFGIHKLSSFLKQNKTWVKRHFSINLVKTYLELQGLSCIELFTQKPLQSMIHSRNFTRMLLNIDAGLKELKTFTRDLSKRLREHNLKTRKIAVSFSSSRFKGTRPTYEITHINIPQPTNYTPTLHKYVQQAFESIYFQGAEIKRISLTFYDLIDVSDYEQKSLLQKQCYTNEKKQKKLMDIMDKTQNRYSKKALFLASETTDQMIKGKNYTTCFNDILTIDMDAVVY